MNTTVSYSGVHTGLHSHKVTGHGHVLTLYEYVQKSRGHIPENVKGAVVVDILKGEISITSTCQWISNRIYVTE